MANITPLKAVFTGATPTGLAEMQATDTIPKAKLEPLVVADVSGAAPLVSPALTGTPTAPTPLTADNSTTLATTALVQAKIAANAPGLAPVQSVAGRTGVVTLAVADVSGAVNKAGDTGLGNMSMGALTTTGEIINAPGSGTAQTFNVGGGSLIRFADTQIFGQTLGLAYLQWDRGSSQDRNFRVFTSNYTGVSNQALLLDSNANTTINSLTATTGSFSGPVNPGSYTVATLPVGTNGASVYASNGRKVGEGAGAGTGSRVVYSNGAWRRLSDETAITA